MTHRCVSFPPQSKSCRIMTVSTDRKCQAISKKDLVGEGKGDWEERARKGGKKGGREGGRIGGRERRREGEKGVGSQTSAVPAKENI